MSIALATAHSVVEPSSTSKRIAGAIVIVYALVSMIPLFWIFATGWKTPPDSISYPPKLVFGPSLEGYCNLFTTRTRQTPEYILGLGAPRTVCERITRERDMVIAGASNYTPRFINSLVIAFGSTFCAVVLGVLAAYGFSRFKVPLKDDLLFFILSTRMLPPVVVAIPMYLMYRLVGLNDTHVGLIILYTAFNLSFSVWLMKGFMDEIPKEYEEAALVDGYTRMQAFFKIVLPEAATGIAATAVFCFITAWNEYAFALIMTNRRAQTAPPFIPSQIGSGLPDWTVIAAGTFLFLLPVAIFTFLLRNHLLRGVTFGAIRK